MSDFRDNHYVPQWYQYRFFPQGSGERKFFYLDLSPDRVTSGSHTYTRKSLLRWGPPRCFFQRDLYTTSFGSYISTEIEQQYFGRIDRQAGSAVEYFATFTQPGVDGSALETLISHMMLQKLRTRKGLRALSEMTGLNSKNQVLVAMQRLRQLFGAIWTEAVWAILDASQSGTKFLLSDHPVTLYNPGCFPGSQHCVGHKDPDPRYSATHTLFPLSLDKLLVLTNLSWVRNPYGNPLEVRPNPELFRTTMFNFTAIQVGRQLTENEVREVNWIIKSRALRYIAAAHKDWLFPEKHLRHTHWDRLGGGYLLFPDPRSVTFTGRIMAGWSDGTSSAWDEYGRRPGDPRFERDAKERGEWETAYAFKGEYARVFGPKRRGGGFDYGKPETEDSPDMHAFHLRQELKGKPKKRHIQRSAKDIQ